MKKIILSAVFALLAVPAFASAATTYYVDVAATGTPDGLSRETAFTSIPAAIAVAIDGDSINIASGLYEMTSQLSLTKAISLIGEGSVTLKAVADFGTVTGSKHLFAIFAGSEELPVTISNITFDCDGKCYGVNTYNNAYGVLNNVTITNSKGAGLTVNGSTIVANNLNTSGNSWGAVNVDPGSGSDVVTPSQFIMNSGLLSENTQIWSDGRNVTDTKTVVVNAPGFTKYNVAGNSQAFRWVEGSLVASAVITKNEISTIYESISSAILSAETGDTIVLYADATTTSQITINKSIILNGNGHTLRANFAKTNNDNNSVIGIVHSGVTVKNLTIDGASGTNLHGINIYLAENVNLDTVTILNTNRSGVVVNGSDVTAANLNTSGNGWNGINIDPGSGVTVPSVFTLTSGTLEEPVQIKSDGNNVSATATVTVNASGYQKYSIAGTESGFVWANALKNAAVITRGEVQVLYSTIQSAVKAVEENETVKVYPGNYNISRDTVTSVQGQTGWYLPISQDGVTLQGVDSTGNSITSADSVAAYLYSTDETPNGAWASQNLVTVFGDNVSIKGLGIMNKISPNKGVEVAGNNFIAENNQFLPVPKTLFASADNYDGGDDITKYGSGVYFNNNGATTTRVATVRNNTFKNSGITFDSFLDNWTVSIINNTFDGNKVWRSEGVDYNYSAIGATTWANQPDFTGSSLDIHDNKFINMTAGKPIVKIKDGMMGTFSATKNWWGTTSLSEIMALISVSGSSTVNISPWYADATMTTLSSEVTETASTKSTVFSTETAYSSNTVNMTIPEGTTITGPLSWDGIFNLPEVTTTYTIPSESSGFWYKPTLAIEMGAEGIALTFDKPVKLTFTGQAGKSAGWSQNGTFHKITSTCTSATAPILEAGADCKIDDGSDLVVWTRHATAFIAFTEEAIPYGGGGGNSASSVVVPTTPASQVAQTAVANTPNTTGQVLGATISEQASGKSQGKVLGASTASFARDMSVGMHGEDIGELQKMLIAEGLLSGEATNYFGLLTKAALAQWQKDNGLPATGYFGSMTRGALSEKEVKKPAVRGANAFAFSKNLRFGLRGADVTELQKILIEKGYLKISTATDYFGPMTKAALVQWQKDNGLPATGYFGAMSREAMNQ